jgi:8-oxo-dGTP pyrophosphatase MutT (NUDIX family)
MTMAFADVVARLEAALAEPLPGPAAQDALAPRPRREWPPGASAARARHAAGLLLVFPIDDAAHIVLTVRGQTRRHAGQVSLPGGVVEPGEAFEQTALREAHEEVALDPALVRILGRLSPLDIPVSGFRLQPIVGVASLRPALTAADGEVARVLEVPLAALLNPASVVERDRVRDGRPMRVPALRIGDIEIWGATAMVLAEFLALLGWKRPTSPHK